MNKGERFNEIVSSCMTEEGIKLWDRIRNQIPPVWDRLASSTKKYHLREDGSVPNVEDHTLEMLYAASKVLSLFNIEKKTKDADIILFSVLLHDAFKYGVQPQNNPHTHRHHDKIAAETIRAARWLFQKDNYTDNQLDILEEAVRHHAGRWSTDLNKENFDSKKFNLQTIFLHILDMLSTHNCLRMPNGNGVLSGLPK